MQALGAPLVPLGHDYKGLRVPKCPEFQANSVSGRGYTCDALDGLGQDNESGNIEEGEPALDPVQRGVEEGLNLVSALLGSSVEDHQRPHDHEHACAGGDLQRWKAEMQPNKAACHAG